MGRERSQRPRGKHAPAVQTHQERLNPCIVCFLRAEGEREKELFCGGGGKRRQTWRENKQAPGEGGAVSTGKFPLPARRSRQGVCSESPWTPTHQPRQAQVGKRALSVNGWPACLWKLNSPRLTQSRRLPKAHSVKPLAGDCRVLCHDAKMKERDEGKKKEGSFPLLRRVILKRCNVSCVK